ncbi:hypothetical protein B7P43_G07084, partial [Cryptotermes secundus]
RYLGSGCTMTDLHLYFHLGISALSKIVKQVTQEIWRTTKSVCLAQPDAKKWKCIAEDFYSAANYPNCVGAMDGRHVRVIQPTHTGSMYYNYKHYFSVVLLAMCNSNYLFTFVDIGAYGKESDSTVFKNSALYDAIKNNTLKLPTAKPISEYFNTHLPYVIVADEAFALSGHAMHPYPKKSSTTRKKVYNYCHSRARRFIESSFGLLSNKWRIFHRPMNVGLSLAEDIIKACCILHNFVRRRESYKFEETLHVTGFEGLNVDNESRGTATAINVRDNFADYFDSTEGALEWQYHVI